MGFNRKRRKREGKLDYFMTIRTTDLRNVNSCYGSIELPASLIESSGYRNTYKFKIVSHSNAKGYLLRIIDEVDDDDDDDDGTFSYRFLVHNPSCRLREIYDNIVYDIPYPRNDKESNTMRKRHL